MAGLATQGQESAAAAEGYKNDRAGELSRMAAVRARAAWAMPSKTALGVDQLALWLRSFPSEASLRA